MTETFDLVTADQKYVVALILLLGLVLGIMMFFLKICCIDLIKINSRASN